jgi:LacI family transcriptional regulator
VEPDNVSTARDRIQGYREAHKEARVKVAPELIIRTTADRAGGYSAMQEILSLEVLPEAVFAVNNMTALGAMQAIRERGLVVPKDIALVCFDDVEHLAVLSPFMTVINQPTESFGTLSSRLLLDRIGGTVGGAARRVVLDAVLIVRESCGAKARLALRESKAGLG